MYKYLVETYEMKSNIFGSTNFKKEDVKLADYLTHMSSINWELISMTALDTSGDSFNYKLVFRKEVFDNSGVNDLVNKSKEILAIEKLINDNEDIKEIVNKLGTLESKFYELNSLKEDGIISDEDYYLLVDAFKKGYINDLKVIK